jgi:hypothetical protein
VNIRCVKDMAKEGKKRNACTVLVGKPEVEIAWNIYA